MYMESKFVFVTDGQTDRQNIYRDMQTKSYTLFK